MILSPRAVPFGAESRNKDQRRGGFKRKETER